MATDEKILKALQSAITHLKNSISVVDEKGKNPIEDNVWHAAAELEYALFLFSVKVDNEIDKSKWKLNPKHKKAEVGPTLIKAQDLLKEAEKHFKNEELIDAYRNASICRHYILKVQKDFAKKRREELKKKK